MEQELTFEQLPNAVTMLTKEFSELKRFLLDKQQPQKMDQPEKFLTIQETAEFLNLAVPTIYSKVSKGELPVMKRGKRLYFSRIELLEYIKEGRKKSSAEIETEVDNFLKKKGGKNE